MMRNRRAQSTAEYAIVLGVVLAAFVAMQVYVKRGLNARLKDSSDSATRSVAVVFAEEGITVPNEPLKYKQYEPDYTSSTYNVTRESKQKQDVAAGGKAGTFTKAEVLESTSRAADGSQTTAAAPR